MALYWNTPESRYYDDPIMVPQEDNSWMYDFISSPSPMLPDPGYGSSLASGGTEQPPPPSSTEQLAGLGGQVGGTATGYYAGSELIGGGEAAAEGFNSLAGSELASSEMTNLPTSFSYGAEPSSYSLADGFSTSSNTLPPPTDPSIFGNFSSMGFGPQAGIILGTTMTAQGLKDLAEGKKSSLPTRVVTAMSTFGGSELARALGFGSHKSTRQRQSDVTERLLGRFADDPAYQAYVSATRAGWDEAPKGPAYFGKYNTFGEYKKAGLDATDLSGVEGNIDLYGNRWSSLNDEQRRAITQLNIDADNYYSEDGGVKLKNKDLAEEFYQKYIQGN